MSMQPARLHDAADARRCHGCEIRAVSSWFSQPVKPRFNRENQGGMELFACCGEVRVPQDALYSDMGRRGTKRGGLCEEEERPWSEEEPEKEVIDGFQDEVDERESEMLINMAYDTAAARYAFEECSIDSPKNLLPLSSLSRNGDGETALLEEKKKFTSGLWRMGRYTTLMGDFSFDVALCKDRSSVTTLPRDVSY